MKKECQEIDGLLIDYADGELAGNIAAEVAGHLAQCRACQAKVKALAKSLAAAQAIWQDTEKTVPGTVSFKSEEKGVRPRECGSQEARRIRQEKGSDPSFLRAKKGPGPFFGYAAVAAGMVVVGVAALLWSVQSRPAPTFDQMEGSIAQAASAARILAAADIVGAQDGGKQAAKEQYQLISESYKNTPSGKEVLLRMKSTERRI